jgi:hypothetical protein
VCEAGSHFRPGQGRQDLAPRAAVKIQAKLRTPASQCSGAGRKQRINIRIRLKDRGESIFHDNGSCQIGPALL